MVVVHVVSFGFKEGTDPEYVKKICDGMAALKENCIHPESKKPYMRSSVGGIDNSEEGIQRGFTHVFVCEFESIEDRNYYTTQDPTHRAFVKLITSDVYVQVLDFTPGVF